MAPQHCEPLHHDNSGSAQCSLDLKSKNQVIVLKDFKNQVIVLKDFKNQVIVLKDFKNQVIVLK